MKHTLTAIVTACLLLTSKAASAHRIDEYLQATLLSVGTDRVEASVRLIPGVLVSSSVIRAIDTNNDGFFSEDEQRAYAQQVVGDLTLTIDGAGVQPLLLSYAFPPPSLMREGLGEIHIAFSANLPPGGPARRLILANHHQSPLSVYLMNALVPQHRGIRILAQKRNQQQSTYELQYEQTANLGAPSTFAATRSWLKGIQFSNLFHLGMRHIGEGTDHLLFLLVLLLPAPLLVSASRFGAPIGVRQSLLRILGIVTAFTLGHSITLTLATLGTIRIPSRPIEILIALSIFVSAVHALRPIFSGKEAWIAASFGLIHGLAFATTLDRLGLGHWDRVAGILAFNLGIETMQVIVVASVLPSLIMLSRTAGYFVFRIAGASFAAAASAGWILERSLGVKTPVGTIVNAFAEHSPSIAGSLFVASLLICGRSRTTASASEYWKRCRGFLRSPQHLYE